MVARSKIQYYAKNHALREKLCFMLDFLDYAFPFKKRPKLCSKSIIILNLATLVKSKTSWGKSHIRFNWTELKTTALMISLNFSAVIIMKQGYYYRRYCTSFKIQVSPKIFGIEIKYNIIT